MRIYVSSLIPDQLPDVHGRRRTDVMLGGRPKVTRNTPRREHVHSASTKRNKLRYRGIKNGRKTARENFLRVFAEKVLFTILKK